jgi:uncharacterized protein (DUF1015 family)
MVTLRPVTRALVPVDSDAARRISAPNYDEFQSDREVWDLLQARPENVLRITMAHCHVNSLDQAPEEGGDDALAHAGEQMGELRESPLTREVGQLIWVYEITSPKRSDLPQLGVGGFAKTSEIRTDRTPGGCIVRNEGIRQEKADGRARLIEATRAYIGTVNLAVQDEQGDLVRTLEEIVGSGPCDFETPDEAGNRHRVWIVTDEQRQHRLLELLDREPAAYVADGNHRSAAAADLGKEHFLTVFFPASRLGLEPYNRLLPLGEVSPEQFLEQLHRNFEVEELDGAVPFRPERVHEIGVYVGRGDGGTGGPERSSTNEGEKDSSTGNEAAPSSPSSESFPGGRWLRLTPRSGTYDPNNAAEAIDADIVQRHIIEGILGIADARDKRINYVGGNKDAAYLAHKVDAGEYDVAISLAPVTMEQFMAVCEQNRFMPPKSTWFDPKVRSGLVMALLDE